MNESTDRLANIDARLHHVVWCVRAESLNDVRRFWRDGVGVPLVEFEVESGAVVVNMSWEAGVEVISPGDQPGALRDALEGFLATNGEGVFSCVYEVDDLRAAADRATSVGASVVFEDEISPDELASRLGWTKEHPRFGLKQAVLTEWYGATVCLQESVDETAWIG